MKQSEIVIIDFDDYLAAFYRVTEDQPLIFLAIEPVDGPIAKFVNDRMVCDMVQDEENEDMFFSDN